MIEISVVSSSVKKHNLSICWLLGHVFGNYIVAKRGDYLIVVDVSTSETVLQLKYPQKI